MARGIRVTATGACYVDSVQRYGTGTVQLVIKGQRDKRHG